MTELTLKVTDESLLPMLRKLFRSMEGVEIAHCHIQPDWLLVWEQNDNQLTLLMLNTGTHSDLF